MGSKGGGGGGFLGVWGDGLLGIMSTAKHASQEQGRACIA